MGSGPYEDSCRSSSLSIFPLIFDFLFPLAGHQMIGAYI